MQGEVTQCPHCTHNLLSENLRMPLTKQQAQHIHCQIVQLRLHAHPQLRICICQPVQFPKNLHQVAQPPLLLLHIRRRRDALSMKQTLIPIHIQRLERPGLRKSPHREILVLMIDALRKLHLLQLQKLPPEEISHHARHQIASLHELAGRLIQFVIFRHIPTIRHPLSLPVLLQHIHPHDVHFLTLQHIQRSLCRKEMVVRIDKAHILPLCPTHPRIASRTQPPVLLRDHRHLHMFTTIRLQQRRRSIRRTVIHNNDLIPPTPHVQTADAVETFLQVRLGIVSRYDE